MPIGAEFNTEKILREAAEAAKEIIQRFAPPVIEQPPLPYNRDSSDLSIAAYIRHIERSIDMAIDATTGDFVMMQKNWALMVDEKPANRVRKTAAYIVSNFSRNEQYASLVAAVSLAKDDSEDLKYLSYMVTAHRYFQTFAAAASKLLAETDMPPAAVVLRANASVHAIESQKYER